MKFNESTLIESLCQREHALSESIKSLEDVLYTLKTEKDALSKEIACEKAKIWAEAKP